MGFLSNLRKTLDFNLCLFHAEKNRKKISKEKRIQAQPYLNCLNDNLSENKNFYFWGSAAHDMSSVHSDVDIVFMPDETNNIQNIHEAIITCGGKPKESKDKCQVYFSYSHNIDDLKIDTSIQLCLQKSSYDLHCMQHTSEYEKNMIWCLNNQLKAGIPKQKLLDKTIIINYLTVLKLPQ